ncbi:MAG: glycosyl hydrolase, partial [Bacteroidetes bacterium]
MTVWHLLPILLLAATAFGLHSCKNQQNTSVQTERGHDPWVFRSVLDLKPRMITLALKKDFWISYDAGRASLYKVWRDGVLFDGPVYTMAHGPQPTSVGPAWLISPFAEPWRVLANGQESTPAVQYRGHSFDKNGQATLRYELSLADGKVVTVTEKPEFVSDDKGRPGLERIFTVENLPAGTQIGLQMHLNSLPTDKSYETDGEFRAGAATETAAGNGSVFATEGLLVLKNTGATRFSAWFVNEPTLQPAAEEGQSNEQPGYALIERSDCKTCHNANVQTVGPSYKAIAEKYKYTSLNVQQLANKVIAGGSGVWGQVAMMAHPDLQMGDAMEMVQYILSLDGEKMQRSAAMSTPTEALAQAGKGKSEGKGVAVNVYTLAKAPSKLADIKEDKTHVFSGVVSKL